MHSFPDNDMICSLKIEMSGHILQRNSAVPSSEPGFLRDVLNNVSSYLLLLSVTQLNRFLGYLIQPEILGRYLYGCIAYNDCVKSFARTSHLN